MSKKKNNMKNAGGKFILGGKYWIFNPDTGNTDICLGADEVYIERIIYNNPATIVFWSDGDKTVSRCAPNDIYSCEIGLAMAILKKLAGSGNLVNTFKNWVPKEVPAMGLCEVTLSEVRKSFR